MTWQPLCDDDPVPGDPSEVSDYADGLTRTADLIVDQVTMLRRLADPTNWVAEAADAFRSKAADLAGDIGKAEGRYRTVGRELTGWSGELERAQSTARSLLQQAQDAAQVLAANPVPTASAPAPGKPAALTPGQESQKSRHDGASDELDRLRGRVASLKKEVEEQAWDRGRRIRSALDDGMENGFFDRFKAFVSDIAEGLRTFAKYMGYIALALGVIALIIVLFASGAWLVALAGYLLTAAAVFTALSLTANTALWVSGNGSWKAVLFDAVSLATFGLGKVFMAGAKVGFKAVQAAAGSERASAAVTAALARSPRVLAGAQRLVTTRFPVGRLRSLSAGYLQGRAAAADVLGTAARETVDVLPEVGRLSRLYPGGAKAAQMRTAARQWADEFPDVAAVTTPAAHTLNNLRLATATTLVADASSLVGSVVKPHSSTTDAGVVKTILSRLAKLGAP